METIYRNKLYAALLLLVSLFIAFTAVAPLAIMKLAGLFVLAIPFVLVILAKIKLNNQTMTVLIILMVYINVFNAIAAFKFVPLILDLLLVFVLLKDFVANGTKNKIVFYLVLSFLVLSLFQMVNPNVPSLQAGLEGFRKTSFYLILLLLGLNLKKNQEDRTLFFKRLVLFSIPILLYGIKQQYFYSSFDEVYLQANDADQYTGQLFGQVRSTSFFAGPFHLGMFSAFIAIACLYLMSTAVTIKQKSLYTAALVVAVLANYSSMTRTNLIALCLILFIYFTFSNSKRVSIVGKWLFMITAAGLLGLLLASDDSGVFTPDSGIFNSILHATSDSRFLGRVEGWLNIVQLSMNQPIMGYGMGSAGDTLGSIYNYGVHVTSHNLLLKFLLETGVFGLLMMLSLIIYLTVMLSRGAFSKTRSTIQRNAALLGLCSLILFLLNGMSIASIEAYPIAGIILFTLGYTLPNQDEKVDTHSNSELQVGR
ncbi:O-antigen ligase family protein [Marinicrinis lubricantis]|uniref:O-antigen ligase family protein n=1 Tax=Marinicrinis lubricantis TaxID=2086470 RepID=A0ABW1IKK4_9BACL